MKSKGKKTCLLAKTDGTIEVIKKAFDSYEDIACLLKCEYITCVKRNIGGYVVDVYCDEEALLKAELPNPVIVTTDRYGNVVEILFGNCLICSHNRGVMVNLKSQKITPIIDAQTTIDFRGKRYRCLQCKLV